MILTLKKRFQQELKKRGLSPDEKATLLSFYDAVRVGSDLKKLYGAHALEKEWSGYFDCQLGDDWLAIYKQLEHEVVLHRTGTHKQLFPHRKK